MLTIKKTFEPSTIFVVVHESRLEKKDKNKYTISTRSKNLLKEFQNLEYPEVIDIELFSNYVDDH